MFFRLSTGLIINLNHITSIPAIESNDKKVWMCMINGANLSASKEDACKIIAHVLSSSIGNADKTYDQQVAAHDRFFESKK